ncbi:MAG: PH domain-containing protein [Mycobacteriaceae bacterium]|nr:PH domain-containing protein [Mycobacteriaceae bacterium]
MAPVRAGTVPAWKYLLYAAVVSAEVAAVSAAVVIGSGVDRIFTGILLGLTVAIPLGALLRRMDGVTLGDDAVVLRRTLRTRRIGWADVRGGRFAYDEYGRWTLALDLAAGAAHGDELVLLSIPPVSRPVSNPYELRKREQVRELRLALRRKRVPVTVVPEIAAALHEHWGIAPPKTPTA